MKLTTIYLLALAIVACIFLQQQARAQVPEKMNYQAVIRNSSDQLVPNTIIGMQISILQDSLTGTAVYVERQTPSTNANGLVSIEIGGGTVVSGSFATIDWASGPHFIKTETDPSGGSDYTITGVNQLLSVPYALHARTTENISGPITYTETDPVFNTSFAKGISAGDTANWNNKLDNYTETQDLADVIAINNSAHAQIKNVTDPSDAQDAVTKAYVDALKEIIYNELLDAGLNGIIKDIDGNFYKTIKIGTQVWMAENLKVTHYSNGDPVQLDCRFRWWTLDTGVYCANDSIPENAITYGYIYNAYAVVDSRNLCPSGWHVPSDEEWTTLTDYLGGPSIAGGKMKERDTIHWWTPNTGATNESGFTGLPGGGTVGEIGEAGGWWSSTLYNNADKGWSRTLMFNSSSVFRNSYSEWHGFGFSVRCLKN